MASILVFPGLRQESLLSIRGRLERDLNAGRDPEDENFWDLTPGSVPSDILMTFALELERVWDFASIDVPAASLVEFAWGEYLDAHGQTIEVPRTEAARSNGEVTFTGSAGTFIAVGTEVGTEQVDEEEEPIVFETTESGTIEEGSPLTLAARAVEPGSMGNVAAGAVTEVLTEVEGVEVTNAQPFVDGEDLEGDESYRERLKLEYSAAHGGGSVDDLRAWALSYPGVGFARVVPLWNGEGTARVVVTDPENNPVSSATEDGLQADLDPVSASTTLDGIQTLPSEDITVKSTAGFKPAGRILVGDQLVEYTSTTETEFKGCTGGAAELPDGTDVLQQGLGQGKAPPGLIVSVDTPTTLAVAVKLKVQLDDGYSLDGADGTVDLTEDIEEALTEYVDNLPPGGEDPPGAETPAGSGTVLLNRVTRAALGVDGLYDLSEVLLGGAAENLTVGPLQVPQLGTVTLEAA